MNHPDPFYCSRCQRGFPTAQSLLAHHADHPEAAAVPLPPSQPLSPMPPPSNQHPPNIHICVRVDRANPFASVARIQNLLALQARARREFMGPHHADHDGQVPLNTGSPLPTGIPLPLGNNLDPSLGPRNTFILVARELCQARARNRAPAPHDDDDDDDGNDSDGGSGGGGGGDDSGGGSGAVLNLVDLN